MELSNKLAFLYLKNQDLKNLTPEQIFDLYIDTFDRIEIKRKEYKNAKFKSTQKVYTE